MTDSAQHAMRASVAALLVVSFTGWSAPEAEAWGPAAHRMVHSAAVDALPKELRRFFSRHRRELATLSPDADIPAEGAERRFEIDRLLPYPFLELPESEEGLRAEYEQAAEIGRLPFLVEAAYGRLVSAMKSGQKKAILDASDELAGLLTDLHNPLALTQNYDGQASRQSGIWVRLSSRLPETLEGDLKVKADAAHLIDDPHAYVFSIVRATYVWADNLLYEEDLATRRSAGRTGLYYDNLREGMRPIVERQLGQATRSVASYWYSAWVEAGRPRLR